MDIFAVPLTPHLRRFEPLMAREVRHTLSLLPRQAHGSFRGGLVLQLHETDATCLAMALRSLV